MSDSDNKTPGPVPVQPVVTPAADTAIPLTDAALAVQKGGSAGTMLRRAREAAGIASPEMATLLKVNEKKLAALEEDRFNDLPDLAFARALAKSICKQLKIKDDVVLDALPRLNVFQGVEHSDVALNMPYRDRSLSAGYSSSRGDMAWMRRKSVWGTAAVLLLIAGMFAVSPDVLKRFASTPKPAVVALSDGTTVNGVVPVEAAAPAPEVTPASPADAGAPTVADQVLSGQAQPAAAGQAAAVPEPAAATTTTTTAATTAPSAPAAATAAPDAVAAPAAGGSGLHFQASQEVWVQVMSGKKRLFERTLQPGETVDVPGEAPLRIVAGRAEAVQITYNGQPLSSTAKGTVGRYRVEP